MTALLMVLISLAHLHYPGVFSDANLTRMGMAFYVCVAYDFRYFAVHLEEIGSTWLTRTQ